MGERIVPPPRHLLIRLPNPLGDAVLATPALAALRRVLPETRITWAGRPGPLAALDGLSDRDAVLPVAGPLSRGVASPFRAGRMWRDAGVDAVLLLPNSWSSAWAAWGSGASRRVGARFGRRGLLLTDTVELPTENGKLLPRSMVDMYVDLVRPFGVAAADASPQVVATGYDRRRAARRLGEREDPVLALNPGAAFGPAKVYPPDRLGEVVRLVRERRPVLVVVLCGPGEETLAAEVARQVEGPCLSTHEAPPDVGELKGLLAASSVLLTADSGPRHLAEALHTPTVVPMGPTDPRWTAHSKERVIRREDLDCLGCHHRVCPIEHPCLADLPPARVADAVLEALG